MEIKILLSNEKYKNSYFGKALKSGLIAGERGDFKQKMTLLGLEPRT